MRILYLDCYAGISGDMTLGAFVDLGVEPGYLISELEKLGVEGYTIEISKKKKNGLVGTDVDVILEADKENQGCHKVPRRAYKDIKALIDKSTLDEKVKALSKKIFHYVAEAEGKIHGQPIDEVHFHEVGAIDSIIDIVGAAICYYKLDVDEVLAGPLHTGVGTLQCRHGIIPIPAPATLEILKNGGIPVYSKGIPNESITPTGAAIVAGLVDCFEPLPECRVVNIGYGCGKRETKMGGLLRMILVEAK